MVVCVWRSVCLGGLKHSLFAHKAVRSQSRYSEGMGSQGTNTLSLYASTLAIAEQQQWFHANTW